MLCRRRYGSAGVHAVLSAPVNTNVRTLNIDDRAPSTKHAASRIQQPASNLEHQKGPPPFPGEGVSPSPRGGGKGEGPSLSPSGERALSPVEGVSPSSGERRPGGQRGQSFLVNAT